MVKVDIRDAHGSRRTVAEALDRLDYAKPNTSAIERRNGTARRMNAHQVRRSLAFSHRKETKIELGYWAVSVYNWCRPNRSLRTPLEHIHDKKSSKTNLQLWLSNSVTTFGQSVNSCSRPFIRRGLPNNLRSLPTKPDRFR